MGELRCERARIGLPRFGLFIHLRSAVGLLGDCVIHCEDAMAEDSVNVLLDVGSWDVFLFKHHFLHVTITTWLCLCQHQHHHPSTRIQCCPCAYQTVLIPGTLTHVCCLPYIRSCRWYSRTQPCGGATSISPGHNSQGKSTHLGNGATEDNSNIPLIW